MPADIAPILAGGSIGVLGTLLGAVVTDSLARRRERRSATARQRRAVNAVVGELLDAALIVDTAILRQTWWPLGDAPRDRAWATYGDDLGELLDDDTWQQLRMTYEAVRSLDALREEPDRRARPWESLTRRRSWAARWASAPVAAHDALAGVWGALNTLRDRYEPIARPEDLREMRRLQEEGPVTGGVGEEVERGSYRPLGTPAYEAGTHSPPSAPL